MEELCCPRCGTGLDLAQHLDLDADAIGIELEISDADKPKLEVLVDSQLDCEIRLTCPHCIWWVRIDSSLWVNAGNRVDGLDEVNARLKPSTETDAYDDATELWYDDGEGHHWN